MNDPTLKELPLNYTLRYMFANKIPLTVENDATLKGSHE